MTKEFSLITLRKIHAVKGETAAKKYVAKYFYQCRNDLHYVLFKGTFHPYSYKSINQLFVNKFPEEIKKWYKYGWEKIYEFKSKIGEPLIIGDTINLAGTYKHKVKEYDSYDEETKKNVEFMLSFIFEVIASSKEKNFNYVMDWVSEMAKGKRNESALYLKGLEGIGKSKFTEFLMQYVLGYNLSVSPDSSVLTTSFNRILCGKLLVVFEELPVFKDWESVDSKFKAYITSPKLNYEDKYEKRFMAENVSNFIINTNVDAMKSTGRRIYFADVSPKYRQNYEYFGKLIKRCFNDKVGEAFFNYLLSRDTTNFNAQDMPETENKKAAIADRLPYEYNFLKQEFILKNKGIDNIHLKKFYESYKTFCAEEHKIPMKEKAFNLKMDEIGVVRLKTNGYNVRRLPYEKLRKIAEDNHWLHELDEDRDNVAYFEIDVRDLEIEKLQIQIEHLNDEIKRMKHHQMMMELVYNSRCMLARIQNQRERYQHIIDRNTPKPNKRIITLAVDDNEDEDDSEIKEDLLDDPEDDLEIKEDQSDDNEYEEDVEEWENEPTNEDDSEIKEDLSDDPEYEGDVEEDPDYQLTEEEEPEKKETKEDKKKRQLEEMRKALPSHLPKAKYNSIEIEHKPTKELREWIHNVGTDEFNVSEIFHT